MGPAARAQAAPKEDDVSTWGDEVQRVLDGLTEDEARWLRRRFGLREGEGVSVESVRAAVCEPGSQTPLEVELRETVRVLDILDAK